MKKPKILIFDIETFPLEVYAWGIRDQHIPVDMVKRDWSIASVSAKFLGENKVHYKDTSKQADIFDDKELVAFTQGLIAQADVLVTQNGIRFDEKRINSRAYFNDQPVTPKRKHIDLLQIGKQYFDHTSHKLAWITRKLESSHQKSSHAKFPGIQLWLECMKGNKEAWREMRLYNAQDVIATEEVYKDYIKWAENADLRPHAGIALTACRACGSFNLAKNGTVRRVNGQFQTFLCSDCGCTTTDKGQKNNLDKNAERGRIRFRDKLKGGK